MTSVTSAFAKYQRKAYPYVFRGQMVITAIAGGIPSDPDVAESWLKTKLTDSDELIREAVAKTMLDRGVTMDEAAEMVKKLKHTNGFKRDEDGLYLEGRCLKACLKEAVNIAANAGKISAKGWGNPDNNNYRKGIKAWYPEHVFIVEDRLYLGVAEPTGVVQRFVHAPQGTGIQYEEYVEDARISFTCETDYDFTEEQWAMVFLTGERQGLGASRSQGFGKFTVTSWEQVD